MRDIIPDTRFDVYVHTLGRHTLGYVRFDLTDDSSRSGYVVINSSLLTRSDDEIRAVVYHEIMGHILSLTLFGANINSNGEPCWPPNPLEEAAARAIENSLVPGGVPHAMVARELVVYGCVKLDGDSYDLWGLISWLSEISGQGVFDIVFEVYSRIYDRFREYGGDNIPDYCGEYDVYYDISNEVWLEVINELSGIEAENLHQAIAYWLAVSLSPESPPYLGIDVYDEIVQNVADLDSSGEVLVNGEQYKITRLSTPATLRFKFDNDQYAVAALTSDGEVIIVHDGDEVRNAIKFVSINMAGFGEQGKINVDIIH